MKKFLLLLVACAIFAPVHRAIAQGTQIETTIHGFHKKSKNYIVSGSNAQGGRVNTPINHPSGGAFHNEGGFVCSDFNGGGSFMFQETAATLSVPNLVGLQGGGLKAYGIGVDRIQMLLEVPKGTSAQLHTTNIFKDPRDIDIPAGTKLRFRTLGGTIQKIEIQIRKPSSKYGSLTDARFWASKDATVAVNDTAIFINVTTPNCGDFTVDMSPSGKPFSFLNIYGTWTPVSELSAPENLSYIYINGQKVDVVDNKIELTVTDRSFFTVPFTTGMSNVVMEHRETDQLYLPTEEHNDNGTFIDGSVGILYQIYASQNRFPHLPATGGKETERVHSLRWMHYGYCLMPIYDSNAKMELPPVSEGFTTYAVLRPWNNVAFADPVTLIIKRAIPEAGKRFGEQIPAIDTSRIPAGCQWDAASKTYYYNKYDTDITKTAIIPFKHVPFGRNFAYTITGETPAYYTNSVIYENNADLPIKLDEVPTAGHRTLYKVLMHDGINVKTGISKVYTFYAEYRPSSGSAPAATMEAPLVYPADNLWQNLEGGLIGYVGRSIEVTIESVESTESTGNFEWQWVPVNDDNWNVSYINDNSAWNKWPTDGNMNIIGTGRLFVREVKTGYTSKVGYRNFRHTSRHQIKSLDPEELKLIPEGALVYFTTSNTVDYLKVIGGYTTNITPSAGKSTGMVFATDKNGNAIRITGNATKASGDIIVPEFNNSNSKNLTIATIVGTLRGQNKGVPELQLTNSSLNYNLSLNVIESKSSYVEPTAIQRATLEKADMSKLVLLNPMTWNGEGQYFTDSQGSIVNIYDCLNSDPKVSEMKKYFTDGGVYRVKGYVGYVAGNGVVLMPIAAVSGVQLMAPNPVKSEPGAGEVITMNVISETVPLNIKTSDSQGNSILPPESELHYVFGSGGDVDWEKAETPINPSETITIDEEKLSDGSCSVGVKLMSYGLESEPVTVVVNKHEVTQTFDNIADFKTLFLGKEDEIVDPSEEANADDVTYYQYTGLARVRAVSDNYIYLSTIESDGTNLTDNLSNNSILLYNEDGWNDTQIAQVESQAEPTIKPKAGVLSATRSTAETVSSVKRLEEGDVITGFALIPYHSSYGNLLGYCTGFASTLRRVDISSESPGAIVKDVDQDRSSFTEADRMLRYDIENVQIKRKEDTSKEVSDPERYTYYLDMEGEPVLTNGVVFESINGWDIAYSDKTLYNIKGVVMLYDASKGENEPGRYQFAMLEFTPCNVEIPAAPEIIISENGVEIGNSYSFMNSATVTIIPNGADNESAKTIFYTTDGSDPRLYGMEYTGPFTRTGDTTIKAYVVSKGSPNSIIAEAVLKRQSIESKYISNFINSAVEGTPYHLTGNVRVAAKGGEYIFVCDAQGHYLPIKVEGPSNILSSVKVGGYLNDMVLTPQIVSTQYDIDIVNSAIVSADYAPYFGKVSDSRPETLEEEIDITSDTISGLTAENVRCYVTITGLRVIDEHTLQTLIGEEIRVDLTALRPEYDFDFNSVDYPVIYKVTGFAMIGEDGKIELLPTAIETDYSHVSGNLIISHEQIEETGNHLVTIVPEQKLTAGSYDIHYTTDGTTPTTASPKYSGAFEMPNEGGIVLAILKENSKEYPGEVAHLNISYIPTGIDGIDASEDSVICAEGGNIIAPEGSEVYDVNGRRVKATGLQPGVYIVKVPGAKAVKIKVE